MTTELHCTEGHAIQPKDREYVERLREALNILYEETADYIRINHLGDVHHNRSMQLARDALQVDVGAPHEG